MSFKNIWDQHKWFFLFSVVCLLFAWTFIENTEDLILVHILVVISVGFEVFLRTKPNNDNQD